MKTLDQCKKLVSEIISNYKDNEWCKQNDDAHESPELFIESEAEKLLSNEWISVKDRLPSGPQEVLICYFGESSIVSGYITIGIYMHPFSKWLLPFNTIEATKLKFESAQDAEYDSQDQITHWMPLPKTPRNND
jgi:hypothetical protein